MPERLRHASAVVIASVALLFGAGVARSATQPGPTSKPPLTTNTTSSVITTTLTSTAVVTATATSTSTATSVATTAQPKPKPKPKPAPAPVLSGALGAGAKFPYRTLFLSATQGIKLSAGSLQITENGRPVSDLTVSPLSASTPGQLGVMLVIDQGPTMSGSLTAAMDAARAFAAQRLPGERLGLVTFAGTPALILAPSADASTILQALSPAPWIAPGFDPESALRLAYEQLTQSGVAVGAVVFVTDIAQPVSAPDPTTDIGLGAGIQTHILGVRDGNFDPTGFAAFDATSTQFVATQALTRALAGVWASLRGGYLVRYRSPVTAGSNVNLAVRATGAASPLRLAYAAPAASHAPAPARTPVPAPVPPTPRAAPQPSLVTTRPSAKPTPTFWGASSSALVVAGACALLLGLAALLLVGRNGGRRALQARVASAIGEGAGAPSLADATADTDPKPGSTFLSKASWWPRYVKQVESARFGRSPVQLVKLAAWGSLGTGLVITLLLSSIAGMFLGSFVGPTVLYVAVTRAARKQRERFIDQLPSHLHDLSGAMRAGRSFVGAIAAVVASADEPIKGELERAMADEQLGKPLDEAMSEIGERMASVDMDQVALIASLHRRTGSNVSEALERVAEGARERADLRRELKALTAQSKLSGRLLGVLPIALVLAMFAIAPQYAQPILHTTGGIVVLVVSALLVLGGWFVMKKITTVDA